MTDRPAVGHVAETFGDVAESYAQARPAYPQELFAWLARVAPGSRLAWDCACGNGQASIGLAGHFDRVVATDASAGQVAAAVRDPRVEYRVADAADSGLADRSVDVVTVAQALHWLPRAQFYAEARRVARPGAVLAAWTYHWLTTGDRDLDAVLAELGTRTLAPYWPAGREHVENRYADLDFPESRLEVPPFDLVQRWDVDRLLTYLRSWSSVSRYRSQHGVDPVTSVEPTIRGLWARSPDPTRLVRWSLTVLAARLP